VVSKKHGGGTTERELFFVTKNSDVAIVVCTVGRTDGTFTWLTKKEGKKGMRGSWSEVRGENLTPRVHSPDIKSEQKGEGLDARRRGLKKAVKLSTSQGKKWPKETR